jgi:hypothetical protein
MEYENFAAMTRSMLSGKGAGVPQDKEIVLDRSFHIAAIVDAPVVKYTGQSLQYGQN